MTMQNIYITEVFKRKGDIYFCGMAYVFDSIIMVLPNISSHTYLEYKHTHHMKTNKKIKFMLYSFLKYVFIRYTHSSLSDLSGYW